MYELMQSHAVFFDGFEWLETIELTTGSLIFYNITLKFAI